MLKHNAIKAGMGGETSACGFTNNAHIREHRLNISGHNDQQMTTCFKTLLFLAVE